MVSARNCLCVRPRPGRNGDCDICGGTVRGEARAAKGLSLGDEAIASPARGIKSASPQPSQASKPSSGAPSTPAPPTDHDVVGGAASSGSASEGDTPATSGGAKGA